MKYFSLLFAHSPIRPLQTPPMKPRFSLLSAAFLSLAFCAHASAATPLFTETFDDNNVDWSYASGGTPSTDNAGWSWSSSTYKARHAVRLGKTGDAGSTTTPSLSIPSAWSKASVTVSFQAAAWYGTTSGLTLSKIENGVTTELDSWSVPQIAANKTAANDNVADLSAFTSDSNGKSYTATFEARDPFKLVFATTGNECRSYLDTVVVTAEEIVSTLTTLPAPANLDTNVLSYTGFSLVWDEVFGATGYVVRVDGDVVARCPPETKTASVTGLAAGGTYAVTVVAQGDGTTTEDSPAAEFSVLTPAYPATIVPDPEASGVSLSAFTVSWTQHPDETYAVRAWTLVPADVATEDFAEYAANGTVPEAEGWIFQNSHEHYPNANAPVDFKADGNWIASPEFGGPVESVSFYIAAAGTVTNSHFFVYGTTGTTNPEDWILLSEVTDSETGKVVSEQKTISVSPSAGIKRIIFAYQKDQGNVRIGTFSVTGTGVGKEPVYLTGYGPDPTDVNTTSVTFANPVVGETYYVEVTATGLSGRTESNTISVPVPVPRRPSVISVQ